MKVRLSTSEGPIDIELDTERAPGTCENFLGYVKRGHYNGTIFHRVIKDFMIQGGGFDAAMSQRATGRPIRNEADNGLTNASGTLAMARTSDPHSASAQFFINTSDNDFLDHRAATVEGWGYCVFGRVISGMDVVERIEASATSTRAGHDDVPVEPIVIERAQLLDD